MEILDAPSVGRKGRKKSQEAYWLFLIGLFLWLMTSFSVGITGYLPWAFPFERIISMALCFIITVLSFMGVVKARKAKKMKAVKSKAQKVGYIGNMILLVVFLLISLNNLMDVVVMFRSL